MSETAAMDNLNVARTALDAIWRASFPDRMTAEEMLIALCSINSMAKRALLDMGTQGATADE